MEKILGWIEKLATGKKSRVFWAFVLVLAFIVVMAYPYIDANFLCYDRIEKRLSNLEKLVSISGQTIYENEALNAEYNSILTEVEDSQAKHITLYASNKESKFDYWVKVIGAGALWFIVAFVSLFSKDNNKKLTLKIIFKKNIWIFFFCMFIGLLLGWLLAKIPVIITPWINAIVYIVAEIMVLYLLMTPKKSQKANESRE